MLGFLGLSKIQLVVSAVILAVLLGAMGVLWMQNKSLRTDLQTSQANVATAQAAVAQQRLAVVAAQENAADWKRAFDGLQTRLKELEDVSREAAAENRRLNELFSKHDLTALARAKPGLIERRINAGTADAFSVLKRISSGDIRGAGGAGAASSATTSAQPEAD